MKHFSNQSKRNILAFEKMKISALDVFIGTESPIRLCEESGGFINLEMRKCFIFAGSKEKLGFEEQTEDCLTRAATLDSPQTFYELNVALNFYEKNKVFNCSGSEVPHFLGAQNVSSNPSDICQDKPPYLMDSIEFQHSAESNPAFAMPGIFEIPAEIFQDNGDITEFLPPGWDPVETGLETPDKKRCYVDGSLIFCSDDLKRACHICSFRF